MPIDTPFVRALVAELNRTAVGARIDKVFMPAPDEMCIRDSQRGGRPDVWRHPL